jgi:CMP-N,N'-diacetyllegionaminic acid synthase
MSGLSGGEPLKIVAMVPARVGSKRVKSKNLRLLDGKPLISHVLSNVAKLSVFDEVYLNSDGKVFEQIALDHGVSFYDRDEALADDDATNDAFAYDFLKSVECDYLIQILPTSPFLQPEEIEMFVSEIKIKGLDGLISVISSQIACIYKGEPVNFSRDRVNPPSQEMTPVLAYATALMGWRRETFMQNYEQLGVAYHCPRGSVDYFELAGLASIDIDNEEDFLLADAIMRAQKLISEETPRYYQPNEAG